MARADWRVYHAVGVAVKAPHVRERRVLVAHVLNFFGYFAGRALSVRWKRDGRAYSALAFIRIFKSLLAGGRGLAHTRAAHAPGERDGDERISQTAAAMAGAPCLPRCRGTAHFGKIYFEIVHSPTARKDTRW